jgi:hypothetical protein
MRRVQLEKTSRALLHGRGGIATAVDLENAVPDKSFASVT